MNATISRDKNGNKIVKLSFPATATNATKQQGFSIQTCDNLPITHRTNEPHYAEIHAWVAQFGTHRQKAVMGKYRIRLTVHPIDRALMEDLGIYDQSTVQPEHLGGLLVSLVSVGYDKIHTYVEDGVISIHCKQV